MKMINKTIQLNQKKGFSYKDIFKIRGELYGIFALYIVFFHCKTYVGFLDGNLLFRFIGKCISQGNMGVDVFLFFSGAGLYQSLKKHSIREFYINRICRVYVPYLICALIFYFWYDLIFVHDGIGRYLLKASGIGWWVLGGGTPLWYVSFLLAMVLIYPVLYYLNKSTRGIGTCVILVGSFLICQVLYVHGAPIMQTNLEKGLTRIPIFMLGIFLSDYLYRADTVSLKKVIGFLGGSGLLCLISCCIIGGGIPSVKRYIVGLTGLAAVLVLTAIRVFLFPDMKFRLLNWLGTLSYEIYLTHVLLCQVLNHYQLWLALPGFAWYLIIPASGIFLGWLVNRCVKRICRLWRP